MRTRTLATLPLCGVLLLAPACGNGGARPSSSRPRATSATSPAPTPSGAPAATAVDENVPGAAVRPASELSRNTTAGATPAPLPPGQQRTLSGDIALDIAISPLCATRGTPVKATITTVDGAMLAGLARYADGKAHNDYFWGEATGGRYVWTWTITPEVPYGPAVALVTAQAPDRRGASREAGFEVKERC